MLPQLRYGRLHLWLCFPVCYQGEDSFGLGDQSFHIYNTTCYHIVDVVVLAVVGIAAAVVAIVVVAVAPQTHTVMPRHRIYS